MYMWLYMLFRGSGCRCRRSRMLLVHPTPFPLAFAGECWLYRQRCSPVFREDFSGTGFDCGLFPWTQQYTLVFEQSLYRYSRAKVYTFWAHGLSRYWTLCCHEGAETTQLRCWVLWVWDFTDGSSSRLGLTAQGLRINAVFIRVHGAQHHSK